jgi:PIN domain nuclease of toxin-antitoxin system
VKLLLDTHIWVRALSRPEKLSRAVRREIGSPRNELYLSPVSVWEAHHIHGRGKLQTTLSFPEWLDNALEQVPVREAPFNFAVALEASRIHLPQNDFGDVFLAATASLLDLTLVTADTGLLACSWLKTLAND